MRSLILFLCAVSMANAQPRRSEAGVFDFYVLSLSWSPEHCASPAGQRDPAECNGPRRYGFVVHGLWPQFERGWPQACAGAGLDIPAPLRRDILEIMPSERLVSHEWRTHGTCSGLTAPKYFESILSAWADVRIPPRLKNLSAKEVEFAPAEIERLFVAANPQLRANMLSVNCAGRFLSDVRVCLDKNLKPRACSAQADRGCRLPRIIVRPIH